MADTYNVSDVFISYSRKDSIFVHKVFDSLKAAEKEVWADFEDIPKAADWWKEIQAGIDAADSFIFVISPDSVRSDICRQEIEHAVAKGKRFLPLLYRDITEDADKAKIHEAISSHNWIFFHETDDYDTAFKTLLDSVNTDLEHNRILKRLLVRALEWDGAQRNPSYALVGEDLRQAQSWLSTALNKKPAPLALHIDYINFSVQRQQNAQRRTLALVTGGFAVSLVLAILAIASWFSANDARAEAIQARDIAQVSEQQAHMSEQQARSLGLAASAIQALVDFKPDLALQLALQATETGRQPEQIVSSLAEVVYKPGTAKYIGTGTVVNSVAYTADGNRVAAAGESGYLCIWDVLTQMQQTCLGKDDRNWQAYSVRYVSFDNTGHYLLSAITQGKLTLWNVDPTSADQGKIVQEYRCPSIDDGETPCIINAAAMSPDARLVVFALQDGRIGAWNAVENQFIRWLNTRDSYPATPENKIMPAGVPLSIALSSSGYRVLTGFTGGLMVEWYITTGDPIRTYFNGIASFVTAVAFDPSGLKAVSGDERGDITLWDLTTGLQSPLTFAGHQNRVTALAFHPNGYQFFSASWDNSIFEWDAESSQLSREFYGHDGGINTLVVSADGKYIASGAYDTAVRIWQTQSPIMLSETRDDPLRTTAYDPIHGTIATGDAQGSISLYQEVNHTSLKRGRRFQGYGAVVLDLAFVPDGTSLIALYSDKHLVRRDMSTGKRLWSIVIAQDGPLNLTVMPDNKTLLVVFSSGWGVYDWQTGEEQNWVPFSHKPIRLISPHPNGKWVAVAVNDLVENLFLVDWQTGQIIRSYIGHHDGVTAVAFNHDGSQMLTGSFDTDVRIWETDSGKPLNVFSGHNDRVVTVQFIPRTPLIVSGSNDRTIRLWNVDTGFVMYRYQAHTDRVLRVYPGQDGRFMISTGMDGHIFYWAIPPHLNEMVDWARANRYIRPLTCAEENLYLASGNDCSISTTTN